jgi:biotin carboxyl carrier protein
MYKIKVNQNFHFETELKSETVILNGNSLNIDWIKVEEGKFHIIKDNKSFLAEVVEHNQTEKQFKIKVNNNLYQLDIKDQYDELLKNLGLDNLNSQKIKEIKAPMPGLVLKILVNEGELVSKGENLLILEAMKMENMIKAPTDLIVKRINIKIGDKLEKNQVMLTLT